MRIGLEPKKENIHEFDEGVVVTVIPPSQAVVEFTPVGLAFNDLYRYVLGNVGNKISVSNHEIFATKASEYIKKIMPTSKVKKSEGVKFDNNFHCFVFLHLSKFPNHITENWKKDKDDSELEYVGPKKRTYPYGWGTGEKGGSNYYLNQEDTSVGKEEENALAKMFGYKEASVKEINKVPPKLLKEVEEKELRYIYDMLQNYKVGLKTTVPVKVEIEKKYLSAENQVTVNYIRDFLLNVQEDVMKNSEKAAYVDHSNPYRTAIVKKVYNKSTNKEEYALVSKKDPKKILKWFGKTKPSDAAVLKEEQRVHGHASSLKKGNMTEVVEEILRKKNIPEDVIQEIIEEYIEGTGSDILWEPEFTPEIT